MSVASYNSFWGIIKLRGTTGHSSFRKRFKFAKLGGQLGLVFHLQVVEMDLLGPYEALYVCFRYSLTDTGLRPIKLAKSFEGLSK